MILDAGETPMVVVNCVLTSEPKQFLELCYTRGASEKDTKYVTGCKNHGCACGERISV